MAQITAAFSGVNYPGDWCLRGSNEGDEPYLVEQHFKGETDWRVLDSDFLDQAPPYALTFFSDEAFHFYLPAYLIADIDGPSGWSEPVSSLTYGLEDADRQRLINPRRYGQRTRLDYAQYRFSIFNKQEAAAIVAFLNLRQDGAREYKKKAIDQALKNYWSARAA